MFEKYQPSVIDNVLGQDIVIRALKAISSNVEGNVRLIILNGPSGTGKTTVAKTFAKLLNSRDDYIVTSSLSFYNEIDSNLIKDEEDISLLSQLKRTDAEYKVINLEYFDVLSNKLQSKIYSKLDELDIDTFVIISTDKIDSIISNLKNRAFILNLSSIDRDDMKDRIRLIAESEAITISEEDIDSIVYISDGNIRTALNLLYKYKILDKDIFDDLTKTSRDILIKFMIASIAQDKDKAEIAMTELSKYQLKTIKMSYESLLLEILEIKAKTITKRDKLISILYDIISNKILELFKLMNDKQIYDMFDDFVRVKIALWYLYQRIGNLFKNN